VLEEALGRGPPLIDEPLKGLRGQLRPELSADRPLLLEERAEGRLVKPEEPHVSRVRECMLGAPNPLKVFVIEPIDIRMGVPRIPRSPIHVASIHGPEVRDHINIGLRDVRRNICIDKPGDELGLHYAC
jgi:hypothetical protein